MESNHGIIRSELEGYVQLHRHVAGNHARFTRQQFACSHPPFRRVAHRRDAPAFTTARIACRYSNARHDSLTESMAPCVWFQLLSDQLVPMASMVQCSFRTILP